MLLSIMVAGMTRRAALRKRASLPAGYRSCELLSTDRRIVSAMTSGGGPALSFPKTALAVRLDCSEKAATDSAAC
jgi:hypothetical protein